MNVVDCAHIPQYSLSQRTFMLESIFSAKYNYVPLLVMILVYTDYVEHLEHEFSQDLSVTTFPLPNICSSYTKHCCTRKVAWIELRGGRDIYAHSGWLRGVIISYKAFHLYLVALNVDQFG